MLRYQQAFHRGRPRHRAGDAFSAKHPSMDLGRRAKIFAPFDALRGFSAAIIARETVYEPFRELSDDETAVLDRKIALLRPLVQNSRAARENRVRVEITWFCPCCDPEGEDDEGFGQYRTLTGLLKRIDPVRGQMLVDDTLIDLDDIFDICDPENRFSFEESDANEPD